MKEKPGAQIPWTEINQLLAPDERFEVHTSHWEGFLLAPKHVSKLAALLYLICQHDLPFCVQGRGTKSHPEIHHSLIISARAFSQVVLHEQGVVEVGAGCTLAHLHQFLFEQKHEVALEEDLLSSSKQSIGSLLLSGRIAGIHFRQETISEMILGVELVTWEGCQLKWGGVQRSALAGPSLHQLICGLNSLPGIIVKVILKAYPIPQARLRLAWSFCQKEALWEHFQSLKKFSSTWENLECVLSGKPNDQGFIFAQISGLKEEMEDFSHVCPGYLKARHQGEREILKKFLKQQKLKGYAATLDQLLQPGDYLWYQEMDKRAWWITSQSLEKNTFIQPLWKQRFWGALSGSSEAVQMLISASNDPLRREDG